MLIRGRRGVRRCWRREGKVVGDMVGVGCGGVAAWVGGCVRWCSINFLWFNWVVGWNALGVCKESCAWQIFCI